MHSIAHRLQTAARVALLAAAASFPLASPAAVEAPANYPEQGDSHPSGLAMAADLIVARPLGLVGSALGIALFVVGLPFEAISGDVSGPGRKLVVDPLAFTFTRPLGEFY